MKGCVYMMYSQIYGTQKIVFEIHVKVKITANSTINVENFGFNVKFKFTASLRVLPSGKIT